MRRDRGAPRRQELPTGDDKVRMVRGMFDRIAPRYDLVNRVMTAGMDVGWRRRTVASLGLPRGSLVLDVACGTGDLCRELERTGLVPVGLDLSMGMLLRARTGASLVQADALRLPVGNAVADGVTCGFALRNVVDLSQLLAELARAVRSGGRMALLEVAEPDAGPARLGHAVYFRKVVPLVGGLLSDREAYGYLPRSTEYLPAMGELLRMVRAAGFVRVQRTKLFFGAAQIIAATRA